MTQRQRSPVTPVGPLPPVNVKTSVLTSSDMRNPRRCPAARQSGVKHTDAACRMQSCVTPINGAALCARSSHAGHA
jgi:hypothetical protein